MRTAYVDTSCLVAIVFREAGAPVVAGHLNRFDRLVASNLLEAELRAALAREAATEDPGPLLAGFTWVHPNRRLTPEFDRLVPMGHIKGAELWHLACALFLAPNTRDLTFLTLDTRQREVAAKIGFAVRA